MKKLIFSLSLFLSFSSLVHAQWTTSGNNAFYSLSGNVGIGVANPTNKLDVAGVINTQSYMTSALGFYIPSTSNGINNVLGGNSLSFRTGNVDNRMVIDGGGNVGIGTGGPAAVLTIINPTPVIQLFDKDFNPHDGSSVGKLAFGAAGNEYASIEATRVSTNFDDLSNILFRTSWSAGAGGDGVNIERMRISCTGNVGIGTINPQNKLDVNGTIHSKAVNIDLNGWNDYVFKKDYQLRPLSAVKAYIDQNQHLPEIPSQQEMIKNGLDVSEMNKLLMKKVEELTLYMIEMKEEIKDLQKQNQDLKKQIK